MSNENDAPAPSPSAAETKLATICAGTCFSVAALILLVAVGYLAGADDLQVVGGLVTAMVNLMGSLASLILWTVAYATFLYPVAGLLAGWVGRNAGGSLESHLLIMITVLLAIISIWVQFRLGVADDRFGKDDARRILIGNSALLVGSMLSGYIIHRGVECAGKAGWIK